MSVPDSGGGSRLRSSDGRSQKLVIPKHGDPFVTVLLPHLTCGLDSVSCEDLYIQYIPVVVSTPTVSGLQIFHHVGREGRMSMRIN